MDDNTNAPTCPSCGVPYGDHLGLHGTCAALLEAQREQAGGHIDPNANRARCDLLDGYEEVLREAGVSVGGNPDEAAGQTHHDLGVARMRLALAPLLALRAYLDGGADRTAEWGAVAEEDRHRIERFGDDVAQAFEGADDDPAGLHDEVQELRDEVAQLRATNTKLHRRTQAAEATIADTLREAARQVAAADERARAAESLTATVRRARAFIAARHAEVDTVAAALAEVDDLRSALAEVLGWMPTNREAWVDPQRVAELRRLAEVKP